MPSSSQCSHLSRRLCLMAENQEGFSQLVPGNYSWCSFWQEASNELRSVNSRTEEFVCRQPNPNLHQHRQGTWSMLYPGQIRRLMEPPWATVMPQPARGASWVCTSYLPAMTGPVLCFRLSLLQEVNSMCLLEEWPLVVCRLWSSTEFPVELQGENSPQVHIMQQTLGSQCQGGMGGHLTARSHPLPC